MDIREHRAVQDKVDLAALKDGTVFDDETPPEEMDRRRLSPRQMAALKAFHSGSSLKNAAKAAGVTRQTLHRWRTQYHSFSEAMECWEEGQMVIARSRMVDMATNAVDVLANAIEDGDARAAMMVLKSLRILRTFAPLKAPGAAREQWNSRAGEQGGTREQWNSRAGEQEKEGVAKSPAAAVLPALNDRLEEPSCGAGFQPAVGERERVEEEQAGRLHHNGNRNGNVLENGTPAREAASATTSMTGTTARPAQHINVISNPPVERPKVAILAGKAGSAIENACYSALQEVTGSYEMLPADHG